MQSAAEIHAANANTANILQSERVFRMLVEGVREYAIFLLDPQGNVASWNSGAERIMGYLSHEIIGSHFSHFYPQADKDAGKPAYELKVAAEIGRFEDEDWRIRKDGSRFWSSVVITAIRDETSRLLGYSKITRDLSDRRLAEQRYRQLIEGVTDYAIYSLDVNGNLTSWNTGAQRIKGYSESEIVGRHFSTFYTPEDIANDMPARVLRTAAETGHFEGEGWRVRKDGTRFWASVVVTPVRDDEGELIGFSKITRDVTDRKKLLDQIQKHAEELELRVAEREQTNAELEAFSYSVSHDLRAPLRAIEGFTNAFIEDFGNQVPEEALGYLREVTSATQRMNNLVQDLLNFSRLSRIHIDLHPVSVRQAVEQALGQVSDFKRVDISEVSGNLRVLAHEPTLVQILSNLIANGLKFQPPGRQANVKVKAECSNRRIRISVCDNGIGIELAHQERIFQVFERLHGQEEYPGTGIGLAIVKRGVQRMNGQIGLKSRPGEGSTFSIELPESTTSQSHPAEPTERT